MVAIVHWMEAANLPIFLKFGNAENHRYSCYFANGASHHALLNIPLSRYEKQDRKVLRGCVKKIYSDGAVRSCHVGRSQRSQQRSIWWWRHRMTSSSYRRERGSRGQRGVEMFSSYWLNCSHLHRFDGSLSSRAHPRRRAASWICITWASPILSYRRRAAGGVRSCKSNRKELAASGRRQR